MLKVDVNQNSLSDEEINSKFENSEVDKEIEIQYIYLEDL